MLARLLTASLLPGILAACAAPAPREPLKGHLNRQQNQAPLAAGTIPAPVRQTLALPPPRPAPKAETYSVVVHNVRVEDLLFALARDAKLNVDIYPGMSGNVSLNAIDQTLPQLLSRIAKQVDMRFELDGPNLVVMPDTPFLKHYKMDYVNLSRSVTGTVATNTQISTGGTGDNGTTSALGSGNISSTRVENSSKNMFWDSLEKTSRTSCGKRTKSCPKAAPRKRKSFPAPSAAHPSQRPTATAAATAAAILSPA